MSNSRQLRQLPAAVTFTTGVPRQRRWASRKIQNVHSRQLINQSIILLLLPSLPLSHFVACTASYKVFRLFFVQKIALVYANLTRKIREFCSVFLGLFSHKNRPFDCLRFRPPLTPPLPRLTTFPSPRLDSKFKLPDQRATRTPINLFCAWGPLIWPVSTD